MRQLSIRWLIRLCLVTGLLLSAFAVQSQPSDGKQKARGERNGNQLVSEKPGGISQGQAAARVKQQYKGARIMGINRIEGGAPLYRVRLLSEQGVVKSVFVDGRTGEVFE